MGYCSPRDWLSEIWGHVVWYSNIVMWALVTQCFFFFKANRFWRFLFFNLLLLPCDFSQNWRAEFNHMKHKIKYRYYIQS